MSEPVLGPIDAERIAALAAQLGISARTLLAVAGRIAVAPESPVDAARLDSEIARVRDAGASADTAVDVLLLGYGAHAQGDLSDALNLVWSDAFKQA